MAYPVTVQPGDEKQHPGLHAQDIALTQQPVGYGMQAAAPPGLEYLAAQNRVKVFQILHAAEVLLGWERNNRYRLCNEQDQEFLHAHEDTDCCTRQMLGNIRPFRINIDNMQGQTVMALTRDLRCQGCCCPCCLQEMAIEYPPGQMIAQVKEVWTCLVPRYEVVDTVGNVLFKIEGECCYCACCTDVPFKVSRSDGQPAGEITKHWNGCAEVCAAVNNFSVTFEPGETPLNKAILLGTTFLVDFMFFERNNNN